MSLETYIGVKVIQAEPQDCQKDDHNSKVGDSGYKVIYEDGYESWSPKDVFESAYRKTDGMSFGLALEAMKKGLKVCFEGWNPGVFLEIDKWRDSDAIYIHYNIAHNELWWPEQNYNLKDNFILQDKWQIVD